MLNEKKAVPKLRQEVEVKVDITTSDDIKIYYTGKFQDFTARYITKCSSNNSCCGSSNSSSNSCCRSNSDLCYCCRSRSNSSGYSTLKTPNEKNRYIFIFLFNKGYYLSWCVVIIPQALLDTTETNLLQILHNVPT